MRTTKIYCDLCGHFIDNDGDYRLSIDNWACMSDTAECKEHKIAFDKDLCKLCAAQVLTKLEDLFDANGQPTA